MNAAIIRCTIRQLLSQPVRLGAILGAAILPLLQTLVDPEPRLGMTLWPMGLAVITGAGVIGLEVSNGSLALFFTRPITRAAYVVSRWCGAAIVAMTAVALSFVAEVAIVIARGGELAGAWLTLSDRLFTCAGVVSVLVLFSSLASSLGDLVIWLSVNIVAMAMLAAGDAASMPLLFDIGRVLRRIAIPALDLHRVVASTRIPWSDVTGYAATILLALGIAIAALNRKELSYASE